MDEIASIKSIYRTQFPNIKFLSFSSNINTECWLDSTQIGKQSAEIDFRNLNETLHYAQFQPKYNDVSEYMTHFINLYTTNVRQEASSVVLIGVRPKEWNVRDKL